MADTIVNDSRIIRDFVWVADDTPLPVDLDDYQQLVAARAWAAGVKVHPCTCGDECCSLGLDQRAMEEFRDALRRRIGDLENHERAKLDAWNAGKPIPTSEVIV